MNIIKNEEKNNTIKNLDEINEVIGEKYYYNEAMYYNNIVTNCSSRVICPECGAKLFPDSGCMCCKICGFSACAIA